MCRIVINEEKAAEGLKLSFQYAGTAALKGDVTRSGERKFTGIVRDGYNSASRYYLSHMKDTVRQKAINLFLGVPDQGYCIFLPQKIKAIFRNRNNGRC